MTTSIRKFQQDILDDSNLSHLLNEAYAISIKIKDKKMENWCHYELSGYPNTDSVPKYRKISVRFVADGEFRKNIPAEIPDGYQFLNYHSVTNPISSLLKLTQQKEHQVVSFEFTSELNRKLCELYNQTSDFTFKQQASVSQLVDIESAVKEKIVNWGMHLEPELKKDIDVKDEKPQMINNYNILGNIQNSQIQQGNTNSKQKRETVKSFV